VMSAREGVMSARITSAHSQGSAGDAAGDASLELAQPSPVDRESHTGQSTHSRSIQLNALRAIGGQSEGTGQAQGHRGIQDALQRARAREKPKVLKKCRSQVCPGHGGPSS